LFYPAHIKTPWDRRAFYASQFPLIEDELRELADAVEKLASKAREVHMVFNKSFGNFAQPNAHDLAQLLLEP
jgi:NTP pyrophosphatase (non-canonical NTP hydrolase)